jgi:hypothetical protein
VDGQGGGTITDAVRSGVSNQVNQEYYRFDKCYFANYVHAGFNQANRTGQGKHQVFLDVTMQRGRFGIYVESGSFACYNCGISEMTEANFRLGAITDAIMIVNTDSEGSHRLLTTAGGSNGHWPVIIQGGRHELHGMAADGQYIQWTDGGPLTITGALFGSGDYISNFRILAGTARPGAVLLSMGNGFPNETPYTASSGALRLVSIGNRGRRSDQVPVLLDDEWTNTNTTRGKLRLQTVSGISGTHVHAQNLRGSIRLSDENKSGAVIFATPEIDTNYYVNATATTGTTPKPTFQTGANRVYITGKSKEGFTLNLEAAPGTGNSVTVDWILVR